MVLFSPEDSGPLRHVSRFQKHVAGAELNFSIALSRLGLKVGFVSRVGADEFGACILGVLREEGIDTSLVGTDPRRPTGIYFKEYRGLGDPRVHYYRHGSAASAMRPEDSPADVVAKAKLIHLTGITPLLGDSCRRTVDALVETGKRAGVPISFDPNLRPALLKGRPALREIGPYLSCCTILMLNEQEMEILLGTGDPGQAAREAFSLGVKILAVKRGKGGSWACASDGGEVHAAEGLEVSRPVDPVGAGDGFDAGFVYGYLSGWPLERCLALGNYIGASATLVTGDYEGYPFLSEIPESIGQRA